MDPRSSKCLCGGKSVLALCDSDLLLRVIEINLDCQVQGVSLDTAEPVPLAGEFDLVIIALSAPSNDPVAILHRTDVIDKVKSIPTLVICHQPIAARPDDRIAHLPFPFDSIALRRAVNALLD